MYFKSLINNELQHFHKLTSIRNFSISLTEILESKLFKKEQITPTIYRIYPLFYCSKINTNDTNTKILENKCILTVITENEKYFNFITDEDTPITYDGLDYYTIDDRLTTSEFNAFIQVLKNKLTITDNIRATDGTVTGAYGEYKINLADVTIVDNGILITEETLSANPTVRLIHPIFRNSTYTLKLDVFSISDVNVMEDYNTDNITHDTLEIILEENTDVPIPLGSLDFNRIVSFNANIDIVHDKPVIQYPGSLELTVETDNYIDSTVDCTVVYKDDTGTALTRETVKLRDGETVLATSTTDDEGIATFEYHPTQDKEYKFNVVSEDGLTSNYVIKTIVKHSVNITAGANKSTVFIPGTFTLSGVVTSDYGVMENATLKIMNNNEVMGTAYTNALGEYSREVTCNNVETFTMQVLYEGNNVHYSSNSNYVNVTARKLNSNITINTNRSTVYYSQTVTISGVLKDELGNTISGATVKLYNGNSQVTSTTTDSNGAYSFTRSWALGNYAFKVVYDGDGSHVGVTSSTKNVSMVKAPTSFSTSLPGSINVGANLPIKVVSSYGSFNPTSVTVRLYQYNHSSSDQPLKTETLSEKDSSGNFNFNIPRYATSNFDIVITYDGDSNYGACSQSGTIRIIEANVNSIYITRMDTNLIATFYNNMSPVTNVSLSKATFWFISRSGVTGFIDAENVTTDNQGRITITGALPGFEGGSAYVTYGDIKSNTIILSL